MKKKLIAIVISLLIALTLFPATAHAATFMLGDMYRYVTFDFAARGVQNGDVIVITRDAQYVRLLGNSSDTYTNVAIIIESHGNTNFIIENLNLTGGGGANTIPIVVHGTNNTMEVRGTCNIYAPYDVGIQVESGDELTITGSGNLKVNAYNGGAAQGGAAIGGRYEKGCGTVNIIDCNVTAAGGRLAAAIGGGGGRRVLSGYSYIHYPGGNGGNVNISGNAVVYANGNPDIGGGYVSGNDGSLNVSANAAVFFKNNSGNLSYFNYSSSHKYVNGSYKFGYTVNGTPSSSITTKAVSTLTYDPDGGTGSKSGVYGENSNITLDSGSSFSKDGYTLYGWADSSDGIKDYDLSESFTMPGHDVTLYAVWYPYQINYHLNGGTNNASNLATYEPSDLPLALHSPTKYGYTFDGWSPAGTVPAGSTGYKEFTAMWTPIEYTITYNLDSGTNATGNPATYNIDDDTITLSSPSKTGYTFGGWSPTGTVPAGSTGNKVFTATWTPTEYNITYNLDGGTNATGNPVAYNIEDDTITLSSPSKTGYTFDGWSPAGTVPAGSTGSKEFTAAWTPIEYTITYNLDGGTNATGNPAAYNIEDDTFTLSSPSKTNYTFNGWSPAGTVSTGSTGNKEFTATWTAVPVATPTPTATPTSTPTATPTATTTPTATPSPTATPTPTTTPSPTPMPTSDDNDELSVKIAADVVEEDENTGTITIEIDVSDLPEGTQSVQLPSGDIVKLDGSDTLRLEISEDALSSDGEIELIALDNEAMPLDALNLQVTQAADVINIPNALSAWNGFWSVLIWVLIGIAILAAVGFAVIIILKKKKA